MLRDREGGFGEDLRYVCKVNTSALREKINKYCSTQMDIFGAVSLFFSFWHHLIFKLMKKYVALKSAESAIK